MSSDNTPSVSSYFQKDSPTVFDQLGKSSEKSGACVVVEGNTSSDPNINISHNPSHQDIPPSVKRSDISSLTSDLSISSSYELSNEVLDHDFNSRLFTNVHSSSGMDRSYDAWIPSQSTKAELLEMSTNDSSYKVNKELLVMPNIALKEEFDDPISTLMKRLDQRLITDPRSLTASSVTQDDNGLRQLISAGCYYAAVNLTKQLLSVYGQGDKRLGQFSKHTVHSVQLWFTRIALLVKLQRFSMAEVECEAFRDLNSPDLYFQFYPDLYGGRKGSMVPFSFRLLVAELPVYLGKHVSALNRLSKILSICEQILSNLSEGLYEDGSPPPSGGEANEGGSAPSRGDSAPATNNFDRPESTKLWKSRRTRVLYALTRCAVSLKDYRLAHSLLRRLLAEEKAESSGLFSALGRLSLFLGDIKSAEEAFRRHLEFCPAGAGHDPVLGLVHSSFISCAKNEFGAAVDILKQALALAPQNLLVLNNLAVCLVFVGKIKEAIELVQKSTDLDPARSLHEALVLNLCTMHELESSKAQTKKIQLLNLIASHKGDAFNASALKLMV